MCLCSMYREEEYRMLIGNDVAKWFIFHNPELASGYIDENTKINKLVYFSNLMHRCVHMENLIADDFIAFPNGPVVFSIYRDYRYNGLNRLPETLPPLDKKQEKTLNIINFIYGDSPVEKLIEESHTHSLWKKVENMIPNNPKIDFDDIDNELLEYNRNLYNVYSEMNFSNLKKEKIKGNIYYYMADSFSMTDEIINRLLSFDKFYEPKFLEIVEGELVVS